MANKFYTMIVLLENRICWSQGAYPPHNANPNFSSSVPAAQQNYNQGRGGSNNGRGGYIHNGGRSGGRGGPRREGQAGARYAKSEIILPNITGIGTNGLRRYSRISVTVEP